MCGRAGAEGYAAQGCTPFAATPGCCGTRGSIFRCTRLWAARRCWCWRVTGTDLDLLYAVFQDVWTFPKTFCDYEEYRREAPFLIPRPSSVVRCLRTLRKG